MKIGFIDYYLDEWHANNYPAWIDQASDGEMQVAYAFGMIDSPLPGGRTTAQWCQDMGIERVDSVERLIELSDALVVLSPDNCEMHEALCQLPLRSKKSTYVDKTFAPDGEIAARILKIAQDSGTPCYSTSALRFAAEYTGIDRAGIRAISSWGPGNFETYSIHQLEPVMMLMGARAQRVMMLPGEDWYSLLIDFEDGRRANLNGYKNGSPFAMNIASAAGNQMVTVESDYFHEFIVALVRFFKTGRVEVAHEDTQRIMDVRGAGLRAQRTPGEWVRV